MIVVLPFENLGKVEDDYFAAGVSEEITTRLGSVIGLAVISSKSAVQYAGSTKTSREIGQELGVDYILQGKVRWARTGDGSSRVRISPELVRVADDTLVWADSYDETLEDVFTVQTRIATGVIEQLGVALGVDERQIVEQPTTNDVEAWQAYLRGKEHGDEQDPEQTGLAIAMFERAVSLDAGFVDAWARLGMAHARLLHMGTDTSPARDAAALEAVETALRLAPDSPEAHLAMGFYYYWGHRDYDNAMRHFDIAERATPNSSEVLSARAFVRRRKGDWQGARENFRECESLRPDFGSCYASEATSHVLENGDLAAALSTIGRTPVSSARMPSLLFFIHAMGRDFAAAIEGLNATESDDVNVPPMRVPKTLYAGFARRALGDREGARRDLEATLARLEPGVAANPDEVALLAPLGLAYALLDRDDEALQLGRRAAELFGVDRDAFFGQDVERFAALIAQ